MQTSRGGSGLSGGVGENGEREGAHDRVKPFRQRSATTKRTRPVVQTHTSCAHIAVAVVLGDWAVKHDARSVSGLVFSFREAARAANEQGRRMRGRRQHRHSIAVQGVPTVV